MHKYMNSMAKRLSKSPFNRFKHRRIMSGKLKKSNLQFRNQTVTPLKYEPYHKEISRYGSRSSIRSVKSSRKLLKSKLKKKLKKGKSSAKSLNDSPEKYSKRIHISYP